MMRVQALLARLSSFSWSWSSRNSASPSCLATTAEKVGRGCQVENAIASRVVFLVDVVELGLQLLVKRGVVEVAGEVENSFGKTFPG